MPLRRRRVTYHQQTETEYTELVTQVGHGNITECDRRDSSRVDHAHTNYYLHRLLIFLQDYKPGKKKTYEILEVQNYEPTKYIGQQFVEIRFEE